MRRKIQSYYSRQLICLFGLLTSCATQSDPEDFDLPSYFYDFPGFFMGIWHGALAPFALIGSLFMDIRIYAFPNTGWWYDGGFIIGFIGFLSWVIRKG